MGDAFVATREMRQDAPPCRIGQGRESPIQCLWRIFNHLVNYLTEIYRDASAKICVSSFFRCGRACFIAGESPVPVQTLVRSKWFAYSRPPPLSWQPIGLSSPSRVA